MPPVPPSAAKYNGLENKNFIYSSFNRQAGLFPIVFQGLRLMEAVPSSVHPYTVTLGTDIWPNEGKGHR